MGNPKDIENLEFKLSGFIKEYHEFRPEIAEEDGIVYLRKKGTEIVYVTKDEGMNYLCFSCGSIIMSGQVAHPVHDGPWKGSGGGAVETEEVPYCSKCEEPPNYNGKPNEIGRKIYGWED